MIETTFLSGGTTCAAWHLPGAGDAFLTDAGRPCVVMAHGFGGTRDTGLLGYAEGFAAAGLDVLLFDYRGFAGSGGAPRQLVSYRRQRADYRAAIAAARALDGVDPDRIALWGTSYSGGHIVPVGVRDGRIAAGLSLTPAMDGLSALLALARHGGPRRLLPLITNGVRDALRAVTRRSPHYLPVVGLPGSTAVITAPGAVEDYQALAGPTWRNQVTARTALVVAFNRPIRFASRVRFPLLVQIGDNDAVAPPAAAHRAADKAGRHAHVRTYPVDHFDVYDGPWQQRALADQITFLGQHLGGTVTTTSAKQHGEGPVRRSRRFATPTPPGPLKEVTR
ncbi:alpha/beta hydrolase [Nocardioides stalactiti]|uniref:alpha/beta hydrolase n=1 Tax=Nocardioides stalactiti TaxID=2755356 RepID=UPI0015FFDF96|nr:alpha/beta hydrolase [Nocardioides stalactiti]